MGDWEDRCRDCDDTGITIQTERRCACQPPMTDNDDLPTIERGIPIPSPSHARYPFAVMEVGDAFAVPLTGETYPVKGTVADRALSRVCRAASNYKRMTGRVFTTRTIPNEGVVRCWRVK